MVGRLAVVWLFVEFIEGQEELGTLYSLSELSSSYCLCLRDAETLVQITDDL